MRYLVAALALLASPCFAQSNAKTDLYWLHDGKNTDGTNATLSGFRVQYGLNGVLTNALTVPGAAARTTQIEVPSVGVWDFQVLAVNTAGATSSPTGTYRKLVVANPPAVPTIAPVTVAGPVFAVQTTDNSLVLPEIGSVIAGRACDPTQMVAQGGVALMRIPVASVTLLPGMGSAGLAVFGNCQ